MNLPPPDPTTASQAPLATSPDDAARAPAPHDDARHDGAQHDGAQHDGAAGRPGRTVGIDVVRAVALIGVVVMNYHGYLGSDAYEGRNWAERLFNPWIGVLSTRFAATFVVVAGIGVTLLSRRAVASGDARAITDERWRLRRRGLLLLAAGHVIDWIWWGTILPFYGLYFIIASFMIRWRARWLVAVGALAALGAAALMMWSKQRELAEGGTLWFYERYYTTSDDLVSAARSPRNAAMELLVNGTHPLLPWIAFLVCGMLLGRALPHWAAWRWRLIGAGVGLLAGGYALATVLQRANADAETGVGAYVLLAARTDPFTRSLPYVVTTLGSSILAVIAISAIAERFALSAPVRLLSHAGQMSLTLYVLHVFVFNVVVHHLDWIRPTGLDTALVFAGGYWVAAILLGALWHQRWGTGPLERLYRRFGG